MGKFNWRAGLAYASQGMRERNEEKRAYERADEEMSMDMAKLLAQSGMPIPENLNVSQEMRTLLDQYGKELGESKLREAERELTEYERKKQIDQKYASSQPSDFDKKFSLFMKDPEVYQKFMQAGLDPMKMYQQIKTMQDIELNRRKLTGEEDLSPSEAGALGVPLGTTKAGAAGKKALTADERNAVTILDNAEAMINQMDELSKELNVAEPGVGAWTQGAKLAAGAKTKINVAAARYESKRKGYASAIAQLHGEVRPTDVDIERFLPMLPSFSDPQDLRDKKIQDFRNMLSERRTNITQFASELGTQKEGGVSTPKDPSNMSNNELKARSKAILKKLGK